MNNHVIITTAFHYHYRYHTWRVQRPAERHVARAGAGLAVHAGHVHGVQVAEVLLCSLCFLVVVNHRFITVLLFSIPRLARHGAPRHDMPRSFFVIVCCILVRIAMLFV